MLLIVFFAPFNNTLGFFIIESLVLLISSDLFTVVHAAKNNFVSKTDCF